MADAAELLVQIRGLVEADGYLHDLYGDVSKHTPLWGPETRADSLAVVELLYALEESLGWVIDETSLSAEELTTFGSLAEFLAETGAADAGGDDAAT